MSNRNWVILGLLATIWGCSFVFTTVALRSLDSVPLACYRIGFAAITLWIIALVKKWYIPKGRIWLHYIIMGSFMCSLPFMLIAWGQQFVPAGLAAILNAGTAIFGAALAPLFFSDERLTWNKAIGVLVGFVGIVVAIGVQNMRELSLYNLGQWAIVLACLCYALGGVYGKKFMREIPAKSNALGMVSMAALSMIVVMVFVYRGERMVPTPLGAVAIAYLAVIATAMAFVIYYYLLPLVGVANVTLVTLLVPVIAIALGAVFLGEKLHSNEYAGFVLVAVGLLMIDGRILHLGRERGAPISRS